MTSIFSTARHWVSVTAPYRLDLTVSVLRRLSTNTVDIFTAEGQYIRAFGDFQQPVVVLVTQEKPETLAVTIEGRTADHVPALALVRRMLGVDRDLASFTRAAKRISWLRPLVIAMSGVKPPRYPTLWEACVNAILFQQVSLAAASSILRRMIEAMSPPIERNHITFHPFPSVEKFTSTRDDLLRNVGLSTSKLATLRRVADAIQARVLDETSLEALPSPEAAARLRQIKGIGSWTATVILLRGLGRLDVFPMNDSSVARNLITVAGDTPFDIDQVLAALGPQRGMLYYHLLLARLKARGDIGRASVAGLVSRNFTAQPGHHG
ncbi:DNA-3-methyladenine glycosylase family protein [Oligoflexus tunisiensis]|uniref:DNA-3-methyladenine glycosylase family protein n=1 Tax=Oligoflexus tunisiensis TaxID=708132 RepID=UPI000ABDD161|nr:DNA-3-methyladenine glycosylase 2 family protein [Oligoflexus tunisiensis]